MSRCLAAALAGILGCLTAAVGAGTEHPIPGSSHRASVANSLPEAAKPQPSARARAGAGGRSGRHSVQRGKLSWYGPGLAGQPTASGERFDPGDLTMAHPTLPLGATVRVTNVANRRSVIVRVNDRGPSHPERVADVSRAAAARLGMVRQGIVQAAIEVLWLPGDPAHVVVD